MFIFLIFPDEPSSNESRIDLKSALRDLEDLLKRESYPVEISTLLYLVVKETPEPRKAFDRIVKGKTISVAYFTLNYTMFRNLIFSKKIFCKQFSGIPHIRMWWNNYGLWGGGVFCIIIIIISDIFLKFVEKIPE